MGDLDQLAKLTFAEETEVITGNAVVWQAGPDGAALPSSSFV
jgi:hypothetical protein